MLSEQQKAIVEAPLGFMLVNAGAGAWKTHTITERIIALIKSGQFKPYQIMSLTFTNKAANEMKGRIIKAIRKAGIQYKTPPTLWTFHSIANQFLRTYADRLGYSLNFSILDSDDSFKIFKQVVKDFEHETQKELEDFNVTPQQCLDFISYIKQWGFNIDKYEQFAEEKLKKASWALEKERVKIALYRGYNKVLYAELDSMDFDDLLVNFYEILQIEDIWEEITKDIRYLFVDEFQDTNIIQLKIVQLLAKKHGNLCVVGDDYQSIYAFRGAQIKNILEFANSNKDVKTYTLETNYRSTPEIVSLGQNIINHNTWQLSKNTVAHRPSGCPVVFKCAYNSYEEAEDIVDSIKERVGATKDYSKCAVLVRSISLTQAIETIFIKRWIPYKIIGGVSFFSRLEIKNFKALLDILVNPVAFNSFKTALAFFTSWFGEKGIQKLIDYMLENSLTIDTLLFNFEELKVKKVILPKGYKALKEFLTMFQTLKTSIDGKSLYEDVTAIMEESWFEKYLGNISKTEEELDNRLKNLEQFMGLVETREKENNPSLSDFLSDITLDDSGLLGKEDTDNAVNILTIHRSKGLEWDNVYLPAVEQDIFPDRKSVDIEDIEEERRLFYVGVTRARDYLQISYSQKRYIFGDEKYMIKSQFLEEIGR